MAGRDPDGDGDGGAPPAQRARPDDDPPVAPVYVCGLEVGLLDVGRVVALNGYPEACKRLAFVSPSFYLERDLLMATKHVRYGPLKRTRLMSLSWKGDVERVSFLLKVGAEVEARDAEGTAALHWAGRKGHASIVRLLLDKGADVKARDWHAWTPLHCAGMKGHASVVLLLLDKGADVNATTPALLMPLHLASMEGHKAVVRLLLDRGANVKATTTGGRASLHYAIEKGHAPVVRLLREAGAV
jgi:ankyrin repeat protein